ncbi:hypothetical protein OIE69_42400 [Actinacidiphila glaucinigra]|uniref:hypothetical protein n=1 Tax=Actinacidiphila glaucinigra TaxID=235986 RepID=UPI002DDAE2B5|nr:hypothetical protein [Actinacidiphila glaucinigra]WSD65056.1 hypothetical protein OIE69_42400 [Actinacidiphila glaucinigra]
MNARFGVRRGALAVIALAAIAASTVPGSTAALADERDLFADNWGVITRNTIGSPVAILRNGPVGSFGVPASAARPPYGTGSLGIEVANNSTTLTPPSEKVDFGNERDFYGNPVLGLTKVGFHVFQTSENVGYGGPTNMPNIRFEIDPNMTAGDNYSTMVWTPPASPVVDRWSPYIDATTTGTWFLTGNETSCTQATPCTFTQLKASFTGGIAPPTILTVAVGKGRDNMWIGAVDGLRINHNIYDFEADGVKTRLQLFG